MANRFAYDAKHFSTNKYQPQLTNWYEILFTQKADSNYSDQDLALVCQTVSLPDTSNPVIEVGYGNSVAKIAGRREYASGSFSFVDAMEMDTEMYFEKWQARIFDPETGKMGWVENYKCNCKITQYTPTGGYRWGQNARSAAKDRIWTLFGCWPSQITYGEMSGESADKKNIQVTIEYDYAKRTTASVASDPISTQRPSYMVPETADSTSENPT